MGVFTKSRFSLWRRWLESGSARTHLDALLTHGPNPEAPLRERIAWIEEVFRWILYRPMFSSAELDNNEIHLGQLKYFLMVLDRNIEWKRKASKVFRSVFRDTSSVGLLVNAGISSEYTFWSEIRERGLRKILLEAPEDHDLLQFFRKIFSSDDEINWLAKIDTIIFSKWMEFFNFEAPAEDPLVNKFNTEVRTALRILTIQSCGQGLSLPVGTLLPQDEDVNNNPFLFLVPNLDRFLSIAELSASDAHHFFEALTPCEDFLQRVNDSLNQTGVNINLVHNIQLLKSRMERIRILAGTLADSTIASQEVLDFVLVLAADSYQGQSIKSFWSQTLQILSRKIVETNADHGHHYIARQADETWSLFYRACGGGFITAFTALTKAMMGALATAGMIGGLLSAINYSVSFLIIHFLDFSLGTKQPAMTASALSQKIRDSETQADMAELKKEIGNIIRSQAVSIAGNVVTVFPVVLLMGLALKHIGSGEYGISISDQESHYILHSVSLLSMAPFYAMFTGVVLWGSSLAAGWANNWFLLRRQYEAIVHHRRFRFVFGTRGAERIALFWRDNISGIVGNTSLGFALGILPPLFKFLSLPLDLRHVTLSTGTVALALSSLGTPILQTAEFWLAIAGLFVIGFFNVTVAFALALLVAIRAQPITPAERRSIYYRLLTIVRPRKKRKLIA